MAPLPDDLIARFRTDYERLLTPAEAPDHRIALAVSGGPDSMAMLGLAAAAFPGRVVAATVDHGLRPESADEVEMVARACDRIGISHAALKIETPKGSTGNLHNWARQERYLLLKHWAIEAGAYTLCTAHHADDQAETFLMRAARATGLSGLAAVRPRSEAFVPIRIEPSHNGVEHIVEYAPLMVLRPLLRWRSHELRSLADQLGLPFVDDPSNHDSRFDRARFRAWLATAPWLDPIQIGKTAENLAAMDEDLREVSRWLWGTRSQAVDPLEAGFDVEGLSRGVKRYLVRAAIDHVLGVNGMAKGGWSAASNVEPLLDALEAGNAATQANVMASAKGNVWHFRPAPPRRSH